MHDVYKFINYYNSNKENKILTVFHDMIADMINNRRLDSIVTELFIRGRKLKISHTTHFFIARIPNKRELKQIATNHSSDISPKDFINISREYTFEPNSFFVNDTTLASDNPLRFRKNIF